MSSLGRHRNCPARAQVTSQASVCPLCHTEPQFPQMNQAGAQDLGPSLSRVGEANSTKKSPGFAWPRRDPSPCVPHLRPPVHPGPAHAEGSVSLLTPCGTAHGARPTPHSGTSWGPAVPSCDPRHLLSPVSPAGGRPLLVSVWIYSGPVTVPRPGWRPAERCHQYGRLLRRLG